MYKHLTKRIRNFACHDYFWRCFKVSFYTFFLEVYYLLYFNPGNIYAPFFDQGFNYYKILLSLELLLSIWFLCLIIVGVFKYKNIDEKHHKVWFWIFMVVIFLWFSTVWYKFGMAYLIDSNNGLLCRSPLQNVVSYWFYGIKTHYEPGLYFVHQSYLLINTSCENLLDFSGILDSHGYVDTTKFYNFVCDNKMALHKCNVKEIQAYMQALSKFNDCFRITIYFGNDVILDKSFKSFFYYYLF